MKITNRHGLPEPLVEAVKADLYSKGDADYSVTELIDSPVYRALLRAHADEIEEDVSDKIWALHGQVIHGILERSDPACRIKSFLHFIDSLASVPEIIGSAIATACRNAMQHLGIKRYGESERRFLAEIGGFKVSGQADLYEPIKGGGWLLSDYKTCKVWQVMGAEAKRQWEEQLNLLLLLADMDPGCPMTWGNTSLQIVAILRDWSKLEKARSKQDYPDGEVVVIPVRKWERDEAVRFIANRTELHASMDGDLSVNGWLRPCTPEDRWQRPTRYAVTKTGNKRALRLLDSRAEAEAWMAANPQRKGDGIEEREGEDIRCQHYCRVWTWCEHGRKIHEAMEAAAELPAEIEL